MYDADGQIYIAYAYGCDLYTNALYKISFKKNCINILSSLCMLHTQDNLFDDVEFHGICPENPFALGDAYLTPLSQHVQ